MIEIREVAEGFEVQGAVINETFRTKVKAIFAACGLAAEHAALTQSDVRIAVPMGWGEAILVSPDPAFFAPDIATSVQTVDQGRRFDLGMGRA